LEAWYNTGWDYVCATYSSCAGCVNCDTKQPTPLPTPHTNQPTPVPTLNDCKEWCPTHEVNGDWDTKCTWSACQGCAECVDTPAPSSLPTPHSNQPTPLPTVDDCKAWCPIYEEADWDTKCSWWACEGCPNCVTKLPSSLPTPLTKQPTHLPTVNDCKEWCSTYEVNGDWDTKCTWWACEGCAECVDTPAPTLEPVPAPTSEPTSVPSSEPTEEPTPQPTVNSCKSCKLFACPRLSVLYCPTPPPPLKKLTGCTRKSLLLINNQHDAHFAVRFARSKQGAPVKVRLGRRNADGFLAKIATSARRRRLSPRHSLLPTQQTRPLQSRRLSPPRSPRHSRPMSRRSSPHQSRRSNPLRCPPQSLHRHPLLSPRSFPRRCQRRSLRLSPRRCPHRSPHLSRLLSRLRSRRPRPRRCPRRCPRLDPRLNRRCSPSRCQRACPTRSRRSCPRRCRRASRRSTPARTGAGPFSCRGARSATFSPAPTATSASSRAQRQRGSHFRRRRSFRHFARRDSRCSTRRRCPHRCPLRCQSRRRRLCRSLCPRRSRCRGRRRCRFRFRRNCRYRRRQASRPLILARAVSLRV
jgi:hypothetical protein